MDVISPIAVSQNVKITIECKHKTSSQFYFLWDMKDVDTNKILNIMDITFCINSKYKDVGYLNNLQEDPKNGRIVGNG